MRNWHDIDTLRESWCLLTIRVTEGDPTELTAWELGDGNMNDLVRTTDHTEAAESPRENNAERLMQELNQRRYDNRLLIVESDQTLETLRTAFHALQTTGVPTLRGFRYVGVQDLIQTYFKTDPEAQSRPSATDHTLDATATHSPVQRLWDLWTSVAPLLPVAAIRGEAC